MAMVFALLHLPCCCLSLTGSNSAPIISETGSERENPAIVFRAIPYDVAQSFNTASIFILPSGGFGVAGGCSLLGI